MKTFLYRYWPSMLTLCVILYATLASHPVGADELPMIPHIDKLIHAVMMGGLVGAVAFDIQRSRRAGRILTRRLMWTIWLGVAVFGLFDEIGQALLTDTRGAECVDYLADIVGAAVAVYAAPPAIYKVLKIK